MHTLYWFQAEERDRIPHGRKSDPLVRACAREFLGRVGTLADESEDSENKGAEDRSNCSNCSDGSGRAERLNGADLDGLDWTIERTGEGKPEFTALPLYFSVSNSGRFWYCLVSETPCGLDVQDAESRDYLRIAERFFRPEESEAVRNGGIRTFYRIWTRKEALGKLLGRGMFQAFPLPVLDGGADEREMGAADEAEGGAADEDRPGAGAGPYWFQEVGMPGDGGFDAICTVCLRERGEWMQSAEVVSMEEFWGDVKRLVEG